MSQTFSRKEPILVLLGALILMGPIMANGGPVMYFDTAAYISHFGSAVEAFLPEGFNGSPPDMAIASDPRPVSGPGRHGPIVGGRSVYYGALAYLGWKTSIWLPVLVQSVALSWLVAVMLRALAADVSIRSMVLIMVPLTLLTSASFFAGLVMPDIWAGIAILALALLWSPDIRLSSVQTGLLLAALAFSALSHSSHLALIVLLLTLCLLVRPFLSSRIRPSRTALAIPALAIFCALFGHVAFLLAVKLAYGEMPISRPHITAHLVDLGPGTRFARQSCPESGLAICASVDRLPMDWQKFLFDRSEGVFAAASPETRRRLSEEQGAFLLGTLSAEPVGTLGGLLADGLAQFWTLSVAEVPITRLKEEYLAKSFPSDLAARTRTTWLYIHPDLSRIETHMLQAITAASAVILLAWAGLQWRGALAPPPRALLGLVTVGIAGLAGNALICGALASPYGRFQARVVWILPLIVLLMWRVRATSPIRSADRDTDGPVTEAETARV